MQNGVSLDVYEGKIQEKNVKNEGDRGDEKEREEEKK